MPWCPCPFKYEAYRPGHDKKKKTLQLHEKVYTYVQMLSLSLTNILQFCMTHLTEERNLLLVFCSNETVQMQGCSLDQFLWWAINQILLKVYRGQGDQQK